MFICPNILLPLSSPDAVSASHFLVDTYCLYGKDLWIHASGLVWWVGRARTGGVVPLQKAKGRKQAANTTLLVPPLPKRKRDTLKMLFPVPVGNGHPVLFETNRLSSPLLSCFSTHLRQVNVSLAPSHTQPFPGTGEGMSIKEIVALAEIVHSQPTAQLVCSHLTMVLRVFWWGLR